MVKQEVSQMAMVEAVLFMSGKDVTIAHMAGLLDVEEADIKEVVSQIQEKYEKNVDGGLSILVRDDAVQMVTHPAVTKVIEKMTKKELEGPLTPVAMEVLAIIAYRGPISKVDIEAVRGVNCSFTLRNLLRRGLIERVSLDDSKRLQYYQTTIDLLRVLGVSSIEELPEFMELSTDKRVDAILYNDAGKEEMEG